MPWCQKGATLDQVCLNLGFFNSPIAPPFTVGSYNLPKTFQCKYIAP